MAWLGGLGQESTHLVVNRRYILTERASVAESTALIRPKQASPSPDTPRQCPLLGAPRIVQGARYLRRIRVLPS